MKTAHRNASRAKRSPINIQRADPTSLLRVMARLQPLTDAEKITLENPVLLAYQKLSTGAGTEQCFHTLAGAINVTMVLCEDIADPLPEQTAKLGLDALMRTLARHQKIGQWGFDALALQHLPPAIDLYQQLLAMLPPLQFSKAMTETIRRMEAGNVLEVTA